MIFAAHMPNGHTSALHHRAVFVGVDTVASIRGLTVDEVYELADAEMIWVWDVGACSKVKRELRFWARELIAPETTTKLTVEQVIASIVPRRDHIAGQYNGISQRELRHLLRLSKGSVANLRGELQPVNTPDGRVMIPRSALENFLRRRWIGTAAPRPPGGTP